jgi:glycosyltransferase involved in cell wall biosynthesis
MLASEREDFDVFIFFTYLYHPTAMGLPLVSDRALLVPTAHDEPPFHQELYRTLFNAPRGILYNTQEERALVEQRFDNASVRSWIAGFGIDEPPSISSEAIDGDEGEDIVYLGRIDPHKMFDLVPFFLKFTETRPKARLVLMGKSYMDLPKHPRIITTGFVDEDEKWRRLQNARVFVMPSEFESLSIVLLESWSVGVPALVNGRCAVLAGHVERSGGGFQYQNYEEFALRLDHLLDAPKSPNPMGESGRRYVARNYGWETVMNTVHDALAHVAGPSQGRD